MKTLLLGMGNPILCDDAVGVRLAAGFKDSLAGTPGLDIIEECSVGGLNLLDLVAGYDRVIVLDAIQTSGGIPGAWYRFTAGALHETLHLTNVHDANFATALELGRRLGLPLPRAQDIHIFAVETREVRTFSERMTPELEKAYPHYASAILGQIELLLHIEPAPGSMIGQALVDTGA